MGSPKTTVERFVAGDPQAFADVVQRHTPLVRSIVARFFRRPFEQDEALQAVWVHLYNKRQHADPDRTLEFAGWVGTLAKHKCLDLLRARSRRREDAEQPAAVPVLPDAPQQLLDADLRAAARAFADTLEPDWRPFFQLHFVEGLPYAEVSERLGITRPRCKYMRKVLARRAQRDRGLMNALGRTPEGTR